MQKALLILVIFASLSSLFDLGSLIYGLNFQNVVILAVFVFSFLRFIFLHKPFSDRFPLLIFFFSVIVYILLISEISPFGRYFFATKEVVGEFKKFVLLPVLTFYIGTLCIMRDEGQRRQYLGFVACVLMGVVALFFAAEFMGFGLISNRFYSDQGRVVGLLSPNKTAYLVSFLLPFLILYYKHKGESLIVLSVVCSGILCLLVTGSRGGALCLLLVVVGSYIFQKTKILAFILGAGVLLAPILFTVSDSFREKVYSSYQRVEQTFEEDDIDKVTSSRSIIWTSLIDYLKKNPDTLALGSGFASFHFIGKGSRPHNMYLKLFVELGLVGIILSGFGLILFFRRARDVLVESNDAQVALCMSTLVILVSFMFSDDMIYSLYSLMGGMCLAPTIESKV